MTTTYRHAYLHTERAGQHFSQLAREFGVAPAESIVGSRRARISLAGAGVTLAVDRAGPDRGTVVVEAADHETRIEVEQTVGSLLHHLAGPDPLSLSWSDPVRPATLADDQALLDLDRRSWDEASSLPSRRMRERSRFFSTGGRSPEGLLLAERDGDLVGMVKVHPKSPFPESAHVFAVINLVVAPERRRQGVAAMLLTVGEHVALARGGRKLNLMVRGGNLPALRLYADHGYVVEGHFLKEFLINGNYVDDLSLSKQISP